MRRHSFFYVYAAVLVGLYLTLVYLLTSLADSDIMVNWGFVSKFFVVAGIFVFIAAGLLISMGTLMGSEQNETSKTVAAFEIGMHVGKTTVDTPAERQDWRPTVLVMSVILGFVLGGPMTKWTMNRVLR